MSTNPINSLSSGYVQSILSSTFQKAGLTNNSANSIGGSSAAQMTDSSQLSPFAQTMGMLQQLQQTDPTKYKQVTQQIATNLQSAAQTAQSQGNTSLANQLNQLATDFSNASQSGQLPNFQDLAHAIGGHHGHHHAHAASSDSDASSSTNTTASTNSAMSQLLSAFQANGTQNAATNPISIILNTLSNSGVSPV